MQSPPDSLPAATPAAPASAASPSAASPFDGACRLADWGVIAATGEDAARFLHGQLTQDMLHLGPGQARLAGFCTAKGRLLATLLAWQRAPHDLLLACSADVLPATLKRLSMFVLRAKCKLADASAAVQLHGLAGPAAEAWLGEAAPPAVWQVRAQETAQGAAQVVRLPDALADGRSIPRFLWAAPAEAAPPALPVLDTAAWAWLEVASGVVRVVGATVEQFVPQMVNLELVGGVNFQKGCYPGQEVVARSQYRGTLKRRGQLLGSPVPLVPGQEIVHSADPGQPAGMVALAASLGGRHAAFAELKLAATEGGSLHLGTADGPRLQLAALPYTLPREAA